MDNLTFNKGITPNMKPLKRPIVNDPTKLGRRSLEEVRQSMQGINKPPIEPKKIEVKDSQMNQQSQHDRINSMKHIGDKKNW